SRVNATIGQVTDGDGRPMPLPSLQDSVAGLDLAETFLYAPVDGPRALREAWRAREQRLGSATHIPSSLPFVTHALTHTLPLVADLFAAPDTDVLVPQPAWENYDLLFQLHADARIVHYRMFDREHRFDLGGLERALAAIRRKGILILNFPSNPTGWTPSPAEAREIVSVVRAHPGPLLAVTDDAYQGWVYETDPPARSLFRDLPQAA